MHQNQRIVTYLRISTDQQSVDAQRLELAEYASRRGWSLAAEYTDQISGAKFTRTGLDAMMAAIRKGRIDIVLCVKLDRLGRSLNHLAGLIAELTAHNVALCVPSQGIDTSSSNPAARLQLNILCAVSEFEKDLVRERTCAGLLAARKRGATLGRPRSIDQYVSE